MADITKCQGVNCPMKESCYRYTAPSSEYRQSWFMSVPLGLVIEGLEMTPECPEYWDNKEYTK